MIAVIIKCIAYLNIIAIIFTFKSELKQCFQPEDFQGSIFPFTSHKEFKDHKFKKYFRSPLLINNVK